MTESWSAVCFTGHRQLHGDPAAQDQQWRWVRYELERCATWLQQRAGTRTGICGMARGADLLFAQAVLDAGLDLAAYIPFTGQTDRWRAADRRTYQQLLEHPRTRPTVLGELNDSVPPARRSAAVNRLMHHRDAQMVADADACVAVWVPGRTGGTYETLRRAARTARPGVHLNPARCDIRFQLPTLAQLDAAAGRTPAVTEGADRHG